MLVHHSAQARPGLFSRARALALLLLLACALFTACAAKTPRPVRGGTDGPDIYNPASLTHIKDFERFPQNLTVYAKNAPREDLRQEQQQAVLRYVDMFFRPWTFTASEVPISEAAWAERAYASRLGYDEKGGPISMQARSAVSANAQFHLYPSLAVPGIIVDNALMRAMPTAQGLYGDPAKAGQGFPFDNYQMTALWLGTPVFISHISADRKWLFCETAMCSGWVEARKVATVDEAFMAAWRGAPLSAVTREPLPAGSGMGLRIGTLLPVKGGQMFVPKRGGSGQAVISRVPAPDALQPFPLTFTPEAAASIGNEFMHRPYGWGGMFFERDCSLMLHDLFTPFGVWLPRNSAAQLKCGWKTSLANMTPEEKAAWLKTNGQPFRTLLGMPGHVTLYVGEYNGQGAIFHAIWGLRVMTAEGEGRAVLGKACVTSLLPGRELRDIIPEKMLLYRFVTAATLLGGGGH